MAERKGTDIVITGGIHPAGRTVGIMGGQTGKKGTVESTTTPEAARSGDTCLKRPMGGPKWRNMSLNNLSKYDRVKELIELEEKPFFNV